MAGSTHVITPCGDVQEVAAEMVEELVRRVCDAAPPDGRALYRLVVAARRDPTVLAPHLHRLLEAGVMSPSDLYRGANSDMQRELVDLVDSGVEPDQLDLLLRAVAQTGGAVAESAFRRWRVQAPPSADRLRSPVGEYTTEGGWTLASDGRRRLCSQRAYALVPTRPKDAPVSGGPAAANCPQCGNGLWSVLNIDTADPRVDAALAHTGWRGRLRVITCYRCACYGTVFCEVAPDGAVRWSPHTKPPEYVDDGDWAMPSGWLTAGPARSTPYQSDAWAAGGSTLGGHPDWVQGADYPLCPSCGVPMAFLALLHGGDFDEWGEGAHYVFLDARCRLAAVNYQQS
ncbi:MAG TPA: hypothetical protein VHJ83_14235 [Micromonosporaceae bacterium]|nr:hypothetical protein [Micromonosporaceae bacterium]